MPADLEALRAAAEKAALYMDNRNATARADFAQSLDALGLSGTPVEPIAAIFCAISGALRGHARLMRVAEAAKAADDCWGVGYRDQAKLIEHMGHFMAEVHAALAALAAKEPEDAP